MAILRTAWELGPITFKNSHELFAKVYKGPKAHPLYLDRRRAELVKLGYLAIVTIIVNTEGVPHQLKESYLSIKGLVVLIEKGI